MIVRAVEERDSPLIFQWLSEPDNMKWLDLTEMTMLKLKIYALSRPTDVYRVFSPSRSHPPIGIVAIVNIHPVHRTGMFWVVLGNKRYSRQGYTAQASSQLLQYGYSELKLNCVSSYVVENETTTPLFKSSLGFVYYGRQRQCHFVDGVMHNRLWHDMLKSEFKPLELLENRRIPRGHSGSCEIIMRIQIASAPPRCFVITAWCCFEHLAIQRSSCASRPPGPLAAPPVGI